MSKVSLHHLKSFHYRDGYFVAWLIAFTAIVLSVSILWIMTRIQDEISKQMRNSLQTVLTTTKEGLRIWAEDTKSDVTAVSEIPQVRLAILEQLRLSNVQRRRSNPLTILRHSIIPALNRYAYLDFVVITPAGLQIAAGQDLEIGANEIVEGNRAILQKVASGQPAVGIPFRAAPAQENAAVRMIAAAPVRDDAGRVVAALAFVLDPTKDFTTVTRLGRMGDTGETYAFDSSGRMLTESRFPNRLRIAGLAESDAAGILMTELRDPGGDTTQGFRTPVPRDRQNYTRMAASAIREEADVDMRGYRDYRGVPVVGAWLWDDELGMGLATEMDLAEANQPIAAVRNLTLTLLVIIGGVIFVIIVLLQNRFRMSKRVFGYEKAAEARRNVAAVVAHDLRNPINSIVLSCSVLTNILKDSKQDGRQLMQRSVEMIHRAGSRMNRLVNDLLDTTNIELGRLTIEPIECEVQPIVEDLAEMVAPLALQKSVDFVYTAGNNFPQIHADPQRLIQILSNLVGNAIKFTPEHGTVTLRAKLNEEHVEFVVCDTGPGIPDDQIPHIFEQYWQATQKKGGAGLGLFIAKGLVEAHGGRIWIETALGQGTNIRFTMPIAAHVQQQSVAQSQSV